MLTLTLTVLTVVVHVDQSTKVLPTVRKILSSASIFFTPTTEIKKERKENSGSIVLVNSKSLFGSVCPKAFCGVSAD